MPFTRPATTPERTLWTFADAVDRLNDVFEVLETGRQMRNAKDAVLTAYNDLANWHEWKYYKRRYNFRTEDSYSTGTLAFDFTGGAFERLVTLTDGTWPTNAAMGVLRINQDHWRIDERKSGTTVTLLPDQNPGADVAAGTSYEWYREAYPLPVLVRREHGLISPSDRRELLYVTPDKWLARRRAYGDTATTTPQFYTILNDSEYYNRLQLVLGPAPSSDQTFEFLFDSYPRPLVTHEYKTGTVSVDSGGTTVTGVTTAFSSAHVGAVIRFSSSATDVTSPRGDNPYVFQRTITAVASATSLTIDSAAPSAIAGKVYSISDPLDLEAGAMLTAFYRLCELEAAQLFDNDAKDIQIREVRFRRALELAQDADRRSGQMSMCYDDDGWLIGEVTPHPE
jgi:hypothetical protein